MPNSAEPLQAVRAGPHDAGHRVPRVSVTHRRETHAVRLGAASARPGLRTADRARELSELTEKLLNDFKVPPPHLVERTPVVAPERVADVEPQVTALPTRRACLTLAHQDAALLVVALAATLRLGAGAKTTLSAEEVIRVRRLAALLHRILPPAARDAIGQRAARMSPEPHARADGVTGSGAR